MEIVEILLIELEFVVEKRTLIEELKIVGILPKTFTDVINYRSYVGEEDIPLLQEIIYKYKGI